MSIQEESTTSGVEPVSSATDEVKAAEATSGESDGLAKNLEKALREKKNAMLKIQEMEAQLKSSNEEKLKQSQQWKELAEAREQELMSVKQALEAKEKKIAEATINGALRNELLKYGMNSQLVDYALRIIDKKNVQLDSDTGVVLGADEVVKDFHKTFAGQSFFTSPKPAASHSAPSMGSSLSGDDAFKAEMKNAKTQKELEQIMRKHNKLM